jgi:hypothetical protein
MKGLRNLTWFQHFEHRQLTRSPNAPVQRVAQGTGQKQEKGDWRNQWPPIEGESHISSMQAAGKRCLEVFGGARGLVRHDPVTQIVIQAMWAVDSRNSGDSAQLDQRSIPPPPASWNSLLLLFAGGPASLPLSLPHVLSALVLKGC